MEFLLSAGNFFGAVGFLFFILGHFIGHEYEELEFRLNLNSPAIDAGNPSPEYNDFDGSRNDMGAYGGSKGNW